MKWWHNFINHTWKALLPSPMHFRSGPCAKKRVICTLVTPKGVRFVGENYCLRAQEVCPRKPGEDYTKCKTICAQPAHAEEMALIEAGHKAQGAVSYLQGIDHYCKDCQKQLSDAGVIALKFGAPPS